MIFSHFYVFARRGDKVQEVSLFFVGRVGEEYDLHIKMRGGWEGEKVRRLVKGEVMRRVK